MKNQIDGDESQELQDHIQKSYMITYYSKLATLDGNWKELENYGKLNKKFILQLIRLQFKCLIKK